MTELRWALDKKILVKDPKQAVLDFVRDNFELCLPFEVHNGYHFQIRISPKEYAKLTKEEKKILNHQTEMEFDKREDLEQTLGSKENADKYINTHYWANCDCYVFNFKSSNSIKLQARCIYGYEGLDESVDYLFIDEDEFDPIIMANMDLSENQKWKRIRVEKIKKPRIKKLKVEIVEK